MKFWFDESVTEFSSDNGLNKNNPFEMKRINIIVGSNNSGKSRFIRTLLLAIENNKLKFQRPSIYLDLREKIKSTYKDYSKYNFDDDYINNYNIQTYNYLEIEVNRLKEILASFIQPNFGSRGGDYELIQKLKNQRQVAESRIYNFSELLEKLNMLNQELSNKAIETSFLELNKLNEHTKFYLPSIRSLKKLYSELDKEYISSLPIPERLNNQDKLTHQNVFQQFIHDKPIIAINYKDYRNFKLKPTQIITGEGFFDDLTDDLLGDHLQRERVYRYQKLISHYFFNNQEISIIPHRKDNILHIKVGNADQFPISQLGDGLQQVIILTYTPYITTKKSMFFIEEPEMHLHAGYVKQILKFLLKETEHIYFMTTHSNYLLDMINESNQITLYRVDKKEKTDDDGKVKFETVIKRCDQDRSVLEVLGVRPSSVFLANCTIWVEGITDRLYLVEYMKKYLEELKEQSENENDESLKKKFENLSRFIDGYHYAFVEYQGANLGHWNFDTQLIEDVDNSKTNGLNAMFVTSKALVIADNDLKSKSRFQDIHSQLGSQLIFTTGKETENSLPKELIIKMFYKLCPTDGYAGSKDKSLVFDEQHLKYFAHDYFNSNKGIGTYMDKVVTKFRNNQLLPELIPNKNSYIFSEGGQGTIKQKTEFCKSIIELMQDDNVSWQLTDSARALCKRIFEHIERCND